MKKTFIVFTEQGRVKGRTSYSIFRKDEKFELIAESDYSNQMNRGTRTEIVAALVHLKELPEEAMEQSGYPNYKLVNELADILIIEGKGLNSYSTI